MSTVFLQIYNTNTNTWENVDSNNTSTIDTDFTLELYKSDLTNYKDGSDVTTCRVYQEDK